MKNDEIIARIEAGILRGEGPGSVIGDLSLEQQNDLSFISSICSHPEVVEYFNKQRLETYPVAYIYLTELNGVITFEQQNEIAQRMGTTLSLKTVGEIQKINQNLTSALQQCEILLKQPNISESLKQNLEGSIVRASIVRAKLTELMLPTLMREQDQKGLQEAHETLKQVFSEEVLPFIREEDSVRIAFLIDRVEDFLPESHMELQEREKRLKEDTQKQKEAITTGFINEWNQIYKDYKEVIEVSTHKLIEKDSPEYKKLDSLPTRIKDWSEGVELYQKKEMLVKDMSSLLTESKEAITKGFIEEWKQIKKDYEEFTTVSTHKLVEKDSPEYKKLDGLRTRIDVWSKGVGLYQGQEMLKDMSSPLKESKEYLVAIEEEFAAATRVLPSELKKENEGNFVREWESIKERGSVLTDAINVKTPKGESCSQEYKALEVLHSRMKKLSGDVQTCQKEGKVGKMTDLLQKIASYSSLINGALTAKARQKKENEDKLDKEWESIRNRSIELMQAINVKTPKEEPCSQDYEELEGLQSHMKKLSEAVNTSQTKGEVGDMAELLEKIEDYSSLIKKTLPAKPLILPDPPFPNVRSGASRGRRDATFVKPVVPKLDEH